jgi:hypothetical protein
MQQLVPYLSHPAVQVLGMAVLVIVVFFVLLLLAVAIIMSFSRDLYSSRIHRRQSDYRPQDDIWSQPPQPRRRPPSRRPEVVQQQPPSSRTPTPQLAKGDLDDTLIKYIYDK